MEMKPTEAEMFWQTKRPVAETTLNAAACRVSETFRHINVGDVTETLISCVGSSMASGLRSAEIYSFLLPDEGEKETSAGGGKTNDGWRGAPELREETGDSLSLDGDVKTNASGDDAARRTPSQQSQEN